MARVFFIGDEVTAAGFRLAGAEIRVPAAGRTAESVADALRQAELVLVTVAAAADLEAGYIERAVRRAEPPVLVIPDAALREQPPDLARAAERVLGIEI